MTRDNQIIDDLRRNIPGFACKSGCHDCCGPVTASSAEMARLPVKGEPAHQAALDAMSCPHLGPKGCEAYDERPLICRLFGTTPRLPCPNGAGPAVMIDPRVERKIHWYASNTRQVLV